MLKNRLIPVLYLKRGYLVRSERFETYSNLGNPVAQVERYSSWDVDELIYIDISPGEAASLHGPRLSRNQVSVPLAFPEVVAKVTEVASMPLTVGGGIRTISDAKRLFDAGADKITINFQAMKDVSFVAEIADRYGSQAIVVSMDVTRVAEDAWSVVDKFGLWGENVAPEHWAASLVESGAGEILLTSVDRDGTGKGYDSQIVRKVSRAVNIPVIALGGVGDYGDFVVGIVEGEASAVAAGNIFHFKELAYPQAKKALKSAGLNFR